jgi:GLPGLI family protein
MRKIFTILTAMCLTVISYAQEFQDVMRYEYIMTIKSVLNPEEFVKENVYLDVWDNNSRFASEERVTFIEFVGDDKNAIYRNESVGTPDTPSVGQNWVVNKEGAKMYYFTKVGSFFMKTEELIDIIKWNILPEQEDYNGMKVQKAETDFGGRHWTVWFTQEIPLIDGPYKFKNLPGFVVKAADKDNDYVFEFLESKKASPFWFTEFPRTEEVSDKLFKRMKETNANKNLLQIIEERGSHWANPTEDAKVREHMTKKFGKEPNPIELY